MNIANLIDRVKVDINREYQRRLMDQDTCEDDAKSPQEIVDRLLKERGVGWLLQLIPQSEMNQLVEEVEHKGNMESTETQTDFEESSKSIAPSTRDCDALILGSNAEQATVEIQKQLPRFAFTTCLQVGAYFRSQLETQYLFKGTF